MQRWNIYWSIEWYLLAIMTTNADLINSSSKRSSWGFCSQHKADSSALEQKSTIDSVSSLFSPLLLCIENFASEIESTRASNQKNKDNCTIAVPWKDQPHHVHTHKHFQHIVSQKTKWGRRGWKSISKEQTDVNNIFPLKCMFYLSYLIDITMSRAHGHHEQQSTA